MMDIERWMAELTANVRAGFGGRLLFLGLQGSYGRGEATEDSDIDVVMVLDRVELDDLDRYRAIVSGMPEGEKACGFVCGAEELRHWPGYDLLQLAQDTRGFFGSLAELLPPMGRRELAEGAAIGASNLYHAACHNYLYGDRARWPGFLAGACTSAFFVIRCLHQLRTGRRISTRRELMTAVEGDERDILAYTLCPERREPPEEMFTRLIRWSGAAMTEAYEKFP